MVEQRQADRNPETAAEWGQGGPSQPVGDTSPLPQNLVMFMSDFVDWVIPDIPKDISQQIHKEKALMVELYMREEQGKQQLLDTWMEESRRDGPCSKHSPKACQDGGPGHYGSAL